MGDARVDGPQGGRRVLVADDEPVLRDVLHGILEPAGYVVRDASDGYEALRTLFAWHPDLVVLDIMMPRMDGWATLERIREVSDVPVILLSGLSREEEKVRGLRGGADDYLVKPPGIQEFLARVEAALRKSRHSPTVADAYRDRVLQIDFARHAVHLLGEPVWFTPQEFRILSALVRSPGVVMSPDQLLDLCWTDAIGTPEGVRVYIGYLRRKLESGGLRLIETVRGFGYRYCPPQD